MAKPSVWEELPKPSPYQMVDLGLPSGLKWADRNVGAENIEDYGDYFAWGETAPRGDDWPTEAPYYWPHCPFNNGQEGLDEEYFRANSGTWMNESGASGILKPEYDAAHIIMGGNWRMPMTAETKELKDGTTRSAETLNGVSGMRFTSKTNGNSIFMPFAGYRENSVVVKEGQQGYVWTSSHGLSSTVKLYDSTDFEFYNASMSGNGTKKRYYGLSIRGVC